MADLVNILILSLIGSVFALIGGVFFLFKKSWFEALSKYSISFAAGVLVTVALISLIPEAMDMSGEISLTFVLVSFFGAYLFEQFFCELHHHNDEARNISKASIPLIIIGDTIHNFVDGVAISASYIINPGLGFITALSTFLHEIPHEIGDFGILLRVGWDKRKIILVNLLSALATLVGAVFVYFYVSSDFVVGVFLSVSAGLFLYLGASDFLPRTHHKNVSKIKTVTALLLGVAIMIITTKLVLHTN